MIRILITDGIEKSAARQLAGLGAEIVDKHLAPEILKTEIRNFDAVIVRSATKITREVIDGALETRRLKLVVRGGVGVDNIDVACAEAGGIAVMNTPGASSRAVAELAIGHMFALARFIHLSNVTMRNGQWNKKQYTGVELLGKTLGLVGFGRIARKVAEIAKALGMNVVYFDCLGKMVDDEPFKYVTLEELLAFSDFISLHVPYDREKGALIGPREFDMMKGNTFLINCARGGVVDEEALLDALDAGKIAGAALDVFGTEPVVNERIIRHEKISMTPHIGASTAEAQERIGEEIVGIIRQKFFGGLDHEQSL